MAAAWTKNRTISRAVPLLAGVIFLGAFLLHLARDPAVVMLVTDGPASWIRPDEEFDVASRQNVSSMVFFARDVNLPPGSGGKVLRIQALRRFRFALDGQLLFDSGPDLAQWKTERQVTLPAILPAGVHRFEFQVLNNNGPALLRVRCDPLAIASDSTWQASRDHLHWMPAVPAQRLWEPSVPPLPIVSGLDRIRFVLVGVAFLAGFIAALKPSISTVWARRLRWVLLGGLLILGCNNCCKLGILCGYDAKAHYEYIQFVATHGSLPRPDAGWQFFQSPLYYVVSAQFSRLLLDFGIQGQRMMMLLRWIPILSAAILVEISFRAARMVFPKRGDLQIVATLVGGLMPVNIYMGQTVGNEPMAAAICGVILLICLRLISIQSETISNRSLLLAGAVLGIAVLTKVSAILWALALALAIGASLSGHRRFFAKHASAMATVAGAMLLVAGWFFARNLLLVGRPAYLESSAAKVAWWQDPGYRTPNQLWEFGHLFSRPLFNVMGGFWDCLYATTWGAGVASGQVNWNFQLMWLGLWLGLIPTALIIAGMFRALRGKDAVSPALRLCAVMVCCYTAGVMYTYLRLPIYSCAKGSYLMSVTPCLGLLAAAGFDRLPNSRPLRATLLGMLVCGAVTAYATFFVVR